MSNKSFSKQREEFINGDARIQEPRFYRDDNIDLNRKQCTNLRRGYVASCDRTIIMSKISVFFDNGWFEKYDREIDSITEIEDYSRVKSLLTEFGTFKEILRTSKEIDTPYDTPRIENNLYDCIVNRIKYKYKCVERNRRDHGHDAEILRHVFHYEKYRELKELFKKIYEKRIELKNKSQQV